MNALQAHHRAYAQSLSALLGPDAPRAMDQALYDELVGDFEQADPVAVALAAHDLENSLVVTHTDLLGVLDGIEGAAAIAAIQVVEARHAAVLASLAGLSPVTDVDAFLVTPETEPLAPAAGA